MKKYIYVKWLNIYFPALEYLKAIKLKTTLDTHKSKAAWLKGKCEQRDDAPTKESRLAKQKAKKKRPTRPFAINVAI